MVKKLLLLLIIFTMHFAAFPQQEEKILFSEALLLHHSKYDKNAKTAYRLKEYDHAQELFDTLVQHKLSGTYMDNFKFKQLNNKEIALHDYTKPVLLITYASWCITTDGEIPALNQLADKYHDKVDFVVLFWDSKKTTKKMAKDYSSNIQVVYVDEMENKDAHVVKQLKHSLGLPTIFLLSEDKQIMDIKRSVSHAYGKSFEDSFDMNYNSIYDGLATHLLSGDHFNNIIEPVAVN